MNMYAGVPASAKEKCCAPFNREPRRLTIFALSQGHVLKSDVLKKIRAADDVHGKSVSFSARRAALPDQSRITLRIDILKIFKPLALLSMSVRRASRAYGHGPAGRPSGRSQALSSAVVIRKAA